jgi:hypothetical protein
MQANLFGASAAPRQIKNKFLFRKETGTMPREFRPNLLD